MLPRGMRERGQALVEFALILVLLLGFVFIIIESGRLLQGWLTTQNAARAAGRFAITGQFDGACLTAVPACLDPRVASIKQEGREAAGGLVIDASKQIGEPESFVVEVWGQDETNVWKPDFAGTAGKPVRVKVSYFMPIVTPFRVIAQAVRLIGQVTVNNEEFNQVSNSQVVVNAPNVNPGSLPGNPLPKADLAITKSASSPIVVAGTSFVYTLDIHNNGTFDAENVEVVDTLPAGFSVTGATAVPGIACAPSGAPPTGMTVTCDLPNLAGDGGPPSSAQVIIDVFVDPDLRGDHSNSASVSNGPSTVDPDLSNNSAAATVTVIGQSDLELISKTDAPDPVDTNSDLFYQVRLRNNGPSTAIGVVLTDTLPAAVSFTSVTLTPPQGTCTLTGNDLVCDIGQLDVGAVITVDIQVLTGSVEGTITNQATVAGAEVDPDPSNNAKSEDTQIVTVEE